jgi:hypothetical protein
MSVLSSRRSRRRLTIAAVFVVVAVPLGYLAVHYSNSASPRDANGPYVSDAFYRQPKHAPFTAEKRRAVSAVLAKFISGAVSKHDLAGTWDLAGPDLRQGMTRDEWLKGQLPIVPFAASERAIPTSPSTPPTKLLSIKKIWPDVFEVLDLYHSTRKL